MISKAQEEQTRREALARVVGGGDADGFVPIKKKR